MIIHRHFGLLLTTRDEIRREAIHILNCLMGENAAFKHTIAHSIRIKQHRIVKQAALKGFLFATTHFRHENTSLSAAPTAHGPSRAETACKIEETSERERGGDEHDDAIHGNWLP